ncbi:metallophosphoesterase family protein [Natrialbaceae archaeon A-CW1-1]
MKALILGDIHLQTTGESVSVVDLPVETHDLVITIGDIIDENRDHAKSVSAGDKYEKKGKVFFEKLNESHTPVVAVPGNHDPLVCTERLVEEYEYISVLHNTVLHGGNVGPTNADFDGLAVAGWGCEEFDFTPAIPAPTYPEIPSDKFNQQGAEAEFVATYVERKTARYLAGIDDFDTFRATFVETPSVYSSDDSVFHERVTTLEERFETLCELMGDIEEPLLLCTHISPFGVPFDRRTKHSHDGRYHFGSLALKLAILEKSPLGVISGHTHQRGLTSVQTGDGFAYLYNPGAPGIASLEVGTDGTFVVEELSIE